MLENNIIHDVKYFSDECPISFTLMHLVFSLFFIVYFKDLILLNIPPFCPRRCDMGHLPWQAVY